jgi:hypothetical protein
MFSGNISDKIHLSNRSTLDLRSGDIISVHVIKRLIGNKWAIGIQGRTFPAISDVDLKPGSRIRALVRSAGTKLTLQIKGLLPDSPAKPMEIGEEVSPLNRWIHSAVLQSVLQRALAGNKASISPSIARKINRLFKKLSAEEKKKELRIARSIAALVEKGFDPGSRGLEGVVKILSLIEQEYEGENSGRPSRKPPEELTRLLKRRMNERENRADKYHPLHLFNHLRNSDETWVFVPYRFATETNTYYGLIKLLLNMNRNNVKRLVLDVVVQDGITSFLLIPDRDRIRLSIYCEDPSLQVAIRKKISELTSKLQNHGVECDDSIYEEAGFDGFFAPWEGETFQGVSIVT